MPQHSIPDVLRVMALRPGDGYGKMQHKKLAVLPMLRRTAEWAGMEKAVLELGKTYPGRFKLELDARTLREGVAACYRVRLGYSAGREYDYELISEWDLEANTLETRAVSNRIGMLDVPRVSRTPAAEWGACVADMCQKVDELLRGRLALGSESLNPGLAQAQLDYLVHPTSESAKRLRIGYMAAMANGETVCTNEYVVDQAKDARNYELFLTAAPLPIVCAPREYHGEMVPRTPDTLDAARLGTWHSLPPVKLWEKILAMYPRYGNGTDYLNTPTARGHIPLDDLHDIMREQKRGKLEHAKVTTQALLTHCPPDRLAKMTKEVVRTWGDEALPLVGNMDAPVLADLLLSSEIDFARKVWDRVPANTQQGMLPETLKRAASMGKPEHMRFFAPMTPIDEAMRQVLMLRSIRSGKIEAALVARSLGGDWKRVTPYLKRDKMKQPLLGKVDAVLTRLTEMDGIVDKLAAPDPALARELETELDLV